MVLRNISPRQGTETHPVARWAIGNSIEKYKSPTGDGNLVSFFDTSLSFIEKYKSPTGDGNVIFDMSIQIRVVLLRNISPRQGTETYAFSAISFSVKH